MNWELQFKAELEYQNSANDHFFEWYVLHKAPNNYRKVDDLIGEWLLQRNVKISCRKGAILIEEEEG